MPPDLTKMTEMMSPLFGAGVTELQRAVRYTREQGFVPLGRPGRGGGSAPATARNVAEIVVALMATDARDRSGLEARRRRLLAPKTGQCLLTGATTLVEAVEAALGSVVIANSIDLVRVGRDSRHAVLEGHAQNGERLTSIFGAFFDFEPSKTRRSGRMYREAVLDGAVLQQIAIDLKNPDDNG